MIYLDYAATTPIDKRVLSVITRHLEDTFGNPSSVHFLGQQAERILEESRRMIAGHMGADPKEIVFTSCGSESDNLALRGCAIARRENSGCNTILISPIEHPAVSQTAQQLKELFDFNLETLPVEKNGRVQLQELESRLGPDTVLVSVMAANNEIGTLNPIREIGALCRAHQIPFHTDAVQYGAHFPLDLTQLPVDLLSLGAHKFYGPKGVGLLYVRQGTPLTPVQTGGSQEYGFRAATENVPLIAGMAKGFQLIQEEATQRAARLRPMREMIIQEVLTKIPGSRLTGAEGDDRLPNHASFVFQDLNGNTLIQVLDSAGFACSSGSACKTGDPKPSSVLSHLGYSPEWALGSLRITLGKDTAQAEVDRFLQVLPGCVERVRKVAS